MQEAGKKIIAEPLETPTISTLPEITWPESLSTEDSLFLFNICCSESFIEKAKEVYRRNQPKIIVTEDGLSTLKYLV